MKKELLLRHIKGLTTAQEAETVINWIDASPANERYYISLLNTSAIENLAEETSPLFTENNNENLENARKAVMSQINKTENYRKNSALSQNSSGRIAIDRKSKKRNSFIFTAIAVACLLLFVSVGINIYQYTIQQKETVSTAFAEPVTNVIYTYYTNSGVKGKIVLPDSSVVWMNSCSKITYPEKFAVAQRDIEFEGEGYFEIAKNPESPMVVKTPKGMEIKVLGTKFVIKSYSNDSFEEATLYSGKISVINRSENRVNAAQKEITATEMNPGESIIFGKKTEPVRSFNVDTLKRSAWKRGQLLFEQMPLEEVCKTLERWHGVEITVNDKSLYNYTFTADFGSESMTQIMELMKFTMPVTYEIKDNKVTIEKRKL